MRRWRIRWIDVMVIGAIVALIGFFGFGRARAPKPQMSEFAQQVRLDPLYQIAVQADGRLRSFESHAKTTLSYIAGARVIRGQTSGVTYLDLIFRPESYRAEEIIFVKNKEVRRQIIDAASGQAAIDKETGDRWLDVGLFPRPTLLSQPVMGLMQRLSGDLIRTAKTVDAIEAAMRVSEPSYLTSNLRIVPPPGVDVRRPWIAIDDVLASTAPTDQAHAAIRKTGNIEGLKEDVQKNLADAWGALGAAWRAQDAAKVNAEIEKLVAMVHGLQSPLYPSVKRLEMESWYFRYKSMTWVWLLYLAAVAPLLMSVIYRWDRARTIGMVLFGIAFAAHTVSVAIRWYISGRWPNANMFEAVTTSAWFGGVGALILEWVARRTALRNLFALGSAAMSMIALMAAYFLPAQLDSSLNNKTAALNDIWLYIHTNVIIWSYAVIGLGCVPALLQLRHRWCRLWDLGVIPRFRLILLPMAMGVLNYTAYLLLMMAIDRDHHGLSANKLWAVMGASLGATMFIALEIVGARGRRIAGFALDRGSAGGAASLMSNPAPVGTFLKANGPTATQVFDGATMVLVELAFIMLWTGTVMGAIWADHSWGRPWGWDPKEVFALNTFLIFLILIHVRLKVRDKAFWTAVLAIVGFEVMMFNWIVVNFVISGLHSYA